MNKIDYRLRRLRIVYIIIAAAIIIISGIALALYNSRHMCGIPSGGTIYEVCTSASKLGHGISPAVIVIEAAILIAGFFFLPRLHRYLTPPAEDENGQQLS
ncbi:MAG: hypothetical protein WDN27_00635 [Candidatus Saccharibacteria bacterium]